MMKLYKNRAPDPNIDQYMQVTYLGIQRNVETKSEHPLDSLGKGGGFGEEKSGSQRRRLEEDVGQILGRGLGLVLLNAVVQLLDQRMSGGGETRMTIVRWGSKDSKVQSNDQFKEGSKNCLLYINLVSKPQIHYTQSRSSIRKKLVSQQYKRCLQ